MEFGPTSHDIPVRDGAGDERVATLVHHHRNQIQTMASLVGLFGRRMPRGAGREAFEDLRARFEGLSFVSFDGSEAPTVPLDLADLVRRVAATLDPDAKRGIVFTAEVIDVSPAHGGLLAQLLTELLVDLWRNGLGDDGRGGAEVLVERLPDGRVRLAGRLTGEAALPSPQPVQDLGRTLADSLVHSVGGTVARGTLDGFWFDAVVPPAPERR